MVNKKLLIKEEVQNCKNQANIMTITLNKFKFLTLFIAFFTLQQCDKNPQITCSTYDTEKFDGFYNVSEICQQMNHGVTFASVVRGSSSALNEIIFLNFNNTGINVYGYIGCTEVGTTSNSLSIYFRIPDQAMGGSASSIAGEGSLIETAGYTQLQFDVQLNEFGQANFCSYRYSK